MPILAYQRYAKCGVPVVFLHGLLGSQADWAGVLDELQKFPQIQSLVLDLPCHGNSLNIGCHNFADVRALLHQTLKHAIGEQPFFLVGYSLGGRLALDYCFNQPNPNLLGVILEGVNIGLQTEAERQSRLQNDEQWANRFRQDPIEAVLKAWYTQVVFADLTDNKRSELIKKRQNNQGKAVAAMLEATSLAKQEDFSHYFKQGNLLCPVQFIIGEQDKKFRLQAEQHRLPHSLIPNAGHNAHWENPTAFAKKLREITDGIITKILP